MKSSIIMSTLIFFMLVEISAQIPNAGFEDWENIQNFEKPLLWNTNQDSNYVRFKKDTMAIEGKYSLKIVPSAFTAWHQCMSYAWTEVSLSSPLGENKSLTFYVKSLPDSLDQIEPVFLRITGEWFASGSFVSDYEWENFDIIEDFTRIQIPITNPNIDSFTIHIFGGAINGHADGCHNRSYSWIDGLGVEETDVSSINSNGPHKSNDVVVFPNPSNGIIDVYHPHIQFTQYQLFTLEGKLLEQGVLNQSTINLTHKTKGVFMLKLTAQNGNEYTEISRQIYIE